MGFSVEMFKFQKKKDKNQNYLRLLLILFKFIVEKILVRTKSHSLKYQKYSKLFQSNKLYNNTNKMY